jgi:hypothetical protein
MKYLRTKKGTGWSEKEDRSVKIWRILLFWIPDGIPDYKNKMHLIQEWFIEFDDRGDPVREIGLDSNGIPIVAGPDDRNYGFWMDTNCTIVDFPNDEAVDENEFIKLWNNYYRSQG